MAARKQSRMSFPPIDLTKQKRITKKLLTNFGKLSTQFYGEKCEGLIFQGLCNFIVNQLSTIEFVISPITIQSIASYLLNQTLDYKSIKFLFKFIAANFESIKNNQAITPAKGDDGIIPGWAYVRFKDFEVEIVEGQRPKLKFTLKVISGPWYGYSVKKVIEIGSVYLDGLFYRIKLNSKRRKNSTPRDLVRLYAYVHLVPNGNNYNELGFWDYTFSKYLTNVNKRIISERRKPCPRNYQHPCSSCHVGYRECPRGTRPLTIDLTVKGKNAPIKSPS